MLLVMANGGYLAPPDEQADGEELWVETWKRINRFLPDFFAELFPEEAKKAKGERKAKGKENEKEKEAGAGAGAKAATTPAAAVVAEKTDGEGKEAE